MAIAREQTWAGFGPMVILLTVAFISCGAVSAHGQYYYQPSPDYYRNDTAEGTLIGGAVGAVTGAIFGGRNDRGKGALIGGGVGALAGNLLGREKDNADELRAASGAAAVAQANRQVTLQAVTNFDLIRLTQAGMGEEVIISTIRARGARLDLSPDGLISLRKNGVSDRVLIAAQELSRSYATVQPPPRAMIVTEPVRSTVIIAPGPSRLYGYPPHHRHPHHRGARAHSRFRY